MNNLKIFEQFAPKVDERLTTSKNAVIYTRVSHSSQEDNTSLETQHKNCLRYAESNGYNIVAEFGGKHESAKTDKRKEFSKMLSFVKRSKKVNFIIVNTYDRFSRTGGDGIQIAKELQKKYRVATLAASQGIDPRTISGELQRDLMLLIGYWENVNRIENTVRGMRDLVSKGFTPYSIPRGYINLNKGGKAVDQKIVLNEEGKLLRKAFLWKAEKQMRNCEILERLEKLGLKLNDRRICEIFKNPYYCGILVSKFLPNQAIQGKHEPMISQEVFLKVNNIVAEARNHPVSHKEQDENLPLKRFARCSCCNAPLTGFEVKKKGLWYYKCRTKGCNSNKSAKQLHTHFKNLLSSFKIEESERELIKVGITEMYNAVFEEANENKRLVQKRISELKAGLESAEENLFLGVIERSLFDKYSAKYKKEITDLELELEKMGNGSSNLEKCINFALDFCRKPLIWWESANVGEKMILQNLIFPEGIIYNRENDRVLTTKINSLFSRIPDMIKVLRGTKNGERTFYSTFPARVTPAGF